MKFRLPDTPEAEQTPLIKGLLAMLEQLIEHSQKQQEEIEVMKDEIRILKGEKKRPKFTPNKLDESNNNEVEEASESADKAAQYYTGLSIQGLSRFTHAGIGD